MPEIDWSRQIRAHLDSLQAAGIDWLPLVTEPAPVRLPAEPEAPAIDPLEQRRIELTLLAERVTKCDRCPELVATRTQTVFGVGPIGADVMFVGEAPGADEDRRGEPFVGEAGQLLSKIIAATGMQREEIFICNTLRCRPPGNRQPKPEEVDHCREYLDRTIDLVQPKVMVAWGGVAAKALLNTSSGITSIRGKWFKYREIPLICTFHPASLLPGRSPQNKRFVWEDMQAMMKHLGRPIPPRAAS